MTKRRPLVAGNWKLHKTVAESLALVRELLPRAAGLSCDLAIAPVYTSLHAVACELQASKSPIALSAQEVHFESQGAFTGAVSAPLLCDVGCTMCIVGHSERRQLFHETDEGVRRKVRALLEHGLVPIACVGETLEQRERHETLRVVLGQVDAAFDGLTADEMSRVVIAYEPVWAIGTGRNASPGDAQEVHQAIRKRVAETWDRRVADGLRILYGGSVKPDNAAELLAQPDVDGALVGGASLKADAFLAIALAAR